MRDPPSSLFETFENPLSHEIQTQNQHLTGRKTAVGRHTIRIRVISHPIRASYWREESAPRLWGRGGSLPHQQQIGARLASRLSSRSKDGTHRKVPLFSCKLLNCQRFKVEKAIPEREINNFSPKTRDNSRPLIS